MEVCPLTVREVLLDKQRLELGLVAVPLPKPDTLLEETGLSPIATHLPPMSTPQAQVERPGTNRPVTALAKPMKTVAGQASGRQLAPRETTASRQ